MNTWKNNIRMVVPYVPGEQPKKAGVVKLNTNENPYPPAPGVKAALENFNTDSLRLYPDPDTKDLAEALAVYYELKYENVFVGVGSDDVLATAFMTFFNSKTPILFPDVSYSFYSVWAELFRIPYERPALDSEFKMNPKDYYRENGGIIFPNPNAPTSVCEPLDLIRDILDHNRDVVVIVDEAYIDFGGESAVPLIQEYDNLLVVQTFSKSRSMAGIRIGYAMGNRELIDAMKNVKFSFNSYTMNRFALDIGIEALKDKQYFEDNLAKIISTREEAVKELEKRGFTVLESKANFLFAQHSTHYAGDIFRFLKERNVYVRHFNLPRIDNYLRITVGTEEQMKKLYEELDNYK
ncbi:histidinol-phosphate transaminase [Parasporobacterium paucivorans]|uniref:Histidinol-phosphate aminotransferase n=1 Tax=Parasporobacterium paucivorans DSM 15970 TaxID=1122934 RepID=A0A1M6LBM2_9FIRM|nr:histidinol-phosphate transaminase [Parasporobacterium paucivorans]SHJ68620.1 histidinol-phosphate aminotransferase [Parasporobacterium paucivorans DSM 15970]